MSSKGKRDEDLEDQQIAMGTTHDVRAPSQLLDKTGLVSSNQKAIESRQDSIHSVTLQNLHNLSPVHCNSIPA